MRFFKYSSFIFTILYIQIQALLGIYFNYSYPEVVENIVVGLFIYAIFYFAARFIKLDFYFSKSNLKTKTLILTVLIILGALSASVVYYETIIDTPNVEYTNNQLNYLTLIIAESALIITLLIWFLLISLYEMAKALIYTAENEIPGILEKGSEIAETALNTGTKIAGDVAGKIKKTYDESSFPIRNKVRKEKLLAELAELQEVEPEKRNFHKSDYQSKSEDIKQINPLERELRVKELKKQIKDLDNE